MSSVLFVLPWDSHTYPRRCRYYQGTQAPRVCESRLLCA
nr:MAG TPA: hypothetical protein [Caudoviricetes sp.]